MPIRNPRVALALALATAGVSPSFAMTVSVPESPTMAEKIHVAATLWVPAKVMKVDIPARRLTVSHDAVPKIHMPAMMMTFPVADQTGLTRLHKGDPLPIEFEDRNGRFQVIDFHFYQRYPNRAIPSSR